jgi:hypothetical protein
MGESYSRIARPGQYCSPIVVVQLRRRNAHFVLKDTGRNGLYKTLLLAGFVEAARFLGGQLFVPSRTKLFLQPQLGKK